MVWRGTVWGGGTRYGKTRLGFLGVSMSKKDFLSGQAHTDTHLYVASLFETIDGETNQFHAGTWSVFIRLQGCRVGCKWCDTKYSWPINKAGKHLTPAQIVTILDGSTTAHKVTITGGEPMEQWGAALHALLGTLNQLAYSISMETGGCDNLIEVIEQHPYVNLIVDYKLPSARAVRATCFQNFRHLRKTDVVKLVTTLDEMYDLPKIITMLRKDYSCTARMVFSPIWAESLELATFIERAREVGLPAADVGLSLQTHKYIWPNNVRDEEGPQL